MSRIIVRNLPAKANEDDVRKHFESQGRITDIKVIRKRDGSSRRFAFVGFKSDTEAQNALQYFNLSFMMSSRLDVALAKSLGDESLERRKESLKRKRLEQAEHNESPSGLNSKQQRPETKNEINPKLAEYLSVMQPQKSTAMWKNDNTEGSAKPSLQPQTEVGDEEEDIVDLKELKQKNEDNNNSLEGGYMDADEEKAEEKTEEEPDWVPQATIDDISENHTELSDMEWLRQRQTRIKENGDKIEPLPAPTPEPEEDIMEDTPQSEPSGAVPTNRLFVRNLAFTVNRSELESLFRPFGKLKQVHIPTDPRTDKTKGIAFVEFEELEDSEKAHSELDGQSFQGRLLHIIFAEGQRAYQLDEFDIKNMPLKKQKALKQRMQASKQQFSWNSLYLNRDTVLETTAAKLGLTKSQILDPTSSNMAVKQALAESSVLESVQSYFRGKGVDLAKFKTGRSHELSDTVILAKNLPYQISAVELQDMFAAYGEVVRTLMPPDGGIAIVQFKLASAGRTAFNKLAFRRVGDSILYLQKAPKGALEESEISSREAASPGTSQKAAHTSTEIIKQAIAAQDMLIPEAQQDSSTESALEVRTSVFVKNLNFSTTLESLTKLFQPIPGFLSAIIRQKADPRNPGKQMSMGFGFAEFRTLDQAEVAVKSLQNASLDGHSLQLKISSRGTAEQDGKRSSKAPVTAKIVIKNLPFETSKKDIVDLFGTFGKLRTVRVPQKYNKQIRGFAFAEFATPREAEHAMSSLQGAHLLGRRLVMDYAAADAEDPEAEIAKMEARVAQQVSAEDVHGRRAGGQQKDFDMENLDE